MLNTKTLVQSLNTELSDPPPARADWHSDTLNRRNDWVVKLLGLAEGFDAKEQTILTRRDLSDEGKATELKKLAVDRLAGFDWLRRVIEGLDENHERLGMQLFEVTSPIDSEVLAYFRGMEIRNSLYDVGDPERTVAFLRACEQDQVEIIAALLDAPAGPMIGKDVQDRGLRERARRIMPTEYDRYEQLSKLRTYMHAVRERVAQWLRSFSLDPQTIHGVLGGTVQSNLGTPDGAARLEGSAWARQVAAA